MAELKVGDRVLLLDEDGFLDNADDWDVEVAEFIAKTEEVELNQNIGILLIICVIIMLNLVWPRWSEKC